MEMHECKKCGSRFSDEELAETLPVEYPGYENTKKRLNAGKHCIPISNKTQGEYND